MHIYWTINYVCKARYGGILWYAVLYKFSLLFIIIINYKWVYEGNSYFVSAEVKNIDRDQQFISGGWQMTNAWIYIW